MASITRRNTKVEMLREIARLAHGVENLERDLRTKKTIISHGDKENGTLFARLDGANNRIIALGEIVEKKDAEIARLKNDVAEGIGERGRLREENRERWDIAAVLGKDLKEATGCAEALEYDCDLLRKDLASARARAHDFETRLQGTLMSLKALGEGLSVRRTPK